ncbi:MAG: ABC transporter permease, partial [Planctomycetota bacterium]
ATLNLFLRDVYHLMGVFITVWMFATPIFYPPQKVIIEGYGWILKINPMYWLITSYREILIFGQWPDWWLLAQFALVAVIVLYLGSRFFLAQKPQFPDLL